MRGDFSTWRTERAYNFSGVLHQQGRVLLDRDWNAQTGLMLDWQDDAGQDIVGPGVAGVPADQPDAFKVLKADRSGSDIIVDLAPGRVWADGIPVTIHGAASVRRVATYLAPPVQTPQATKGTIQNGVTRDAVVLEVWREELSGFQIDDLLIEPALGGPDTTERVHTSFALRLYRMADGDTCQSIAPLLRDMFDAKGKLTAKLKPTVTSGDCPVVIGGGYTGFEHSLYRIEIAQTNTPADPYFLWSQFNGGLVGRGEYDAGKNAIEISANAQAILNSGLTQFYLEVVQYDPLVPATPGRGHWRVTYGAPATLDNNGDLAFTAPAVFGGAPPAAGQQVFFRLWNGIRKVADFAASAELVHGIYLTFDSVLPAKLSAGDYWTFPVRAGEIENPETLLDGAAPQGILHHRVPLGVVAWNGQVMTAGSGISDCRRIFQPLTRLQTCCTYRVGDGMNSHGEFTSIQKAIDSLPASGGEICILPGVYSESVVIAGRTGVTIKGCGVRTRLRSPEAADAADAKPVITVKDSRKITIQSLAVEAHKNGPGILLDGEELAAPDPSKPQQQGGLLVGVTLERLAIEAAARSAVEAHILYTGAIRDCSIRMQDVATVWPAIFLVGEDVDLERNAVRVIPKGAQEGAIESPGTAVAASAGRGGIQIGGGSERIFISENLIHGGIGHGITLGSLAEEVDSKIVTRYVPTGGKADPCAPGTVVVVVDVQTTTKLVSEGDLYKITIERNEIYDMGLDGIGPVAFFEQGPEAELISVHGLEILVNVIRRCLSRPIAEIDPKLLNAVAYGAIALPDVDDLVVRDNVIEWVGFDPSMPVCGIFVLHAEGIEISRNRIWCHPLLKGASGAAKVLKPGVRAGIAFTATSPVAAPKEVAGVPVDVEVKTGARAAVVHDNQVSTFMGQALLVYSTGQMSVTDNIFETNGYELSFGLASTVFILDLGIYQDIIYALLAWYLSFAGNDKGFDCSQGRLMVPEDTAALMQKIRFPNGNVLFADNQCRLDLTQSAQRGLFASIFIGSLDDVAIHGNQFDCALGASVTLMHMMALGISLRVTDNRFKEGLPNAMLSAFTFGMMNMTVANQADHCMIIRGVPTLVEDEPNTVMMRLFCQNTCGQFDEVLPTFKKYPKPG